MQQSFGPTADVAIAKSTTQAGVVAGERITYTLTITNAGPQAATNVRVLDLVPNATTVVDISVDNPDATGEYCSLSGVCSLGTVYTTTTATVTLVLLVAGDFADADLVNSAVVIADQRDPNAANNIDDVTTSVTTSADLFITKSDFTDPVMAGETLLYQLIVTNTGPSAARSVRVTDTLPTGASFVGASVQCNEGGGVVVCTAGDLAVGQQMSFLIQVRIDQALADGTTLTNLAEVSSRTPDPDGGNNNAAEPTTVLQTALNPTDLRIAKSDGPDPVVAGETLTYSLRITNAGPAPASNVQVVDALPDAVTLVSVTASQGLCNNGITCDLGDLAVGAAAVVTIVVTVDSDATVTFANQAQVSAANPEINPADNSASASTGLAFLADLAVTKSAQPITATPGSDVTYEIVVVNNGPSRSYNVVVGDSLPTKVGNAVAQSTQGTCSVVGGLVTCVVGSLGVGEKVVVTVIGTVGSDVTAALVNSASVLSLSTLDPIPGNNNTSITTPVATQADLAIRKDGPAVVSAGETLVYTISVYNYGPSDARTVRVTDTFPADVTPLLPYPAGCGLVGGALVCTVGDVAAGATATLVFQAQVDSAVAPGTLLRNRAVVTTLTPDPDPINNSAQVDTGVLGRGDLTISKTGTATANAGELVTYTLVITNNGPSRLRDVSVEDQLPERPDPAFHDRIRRRGVWRSRLPVGQPERQRHPHSDRGRPYRQRPGPGHAGQHCRGLQPERGGPIQQHGHGHHAVTTSADLAITKQRIAPAGDPRPGHELRNHRHQCRAVPGRGCDGFRQPAPWVERGQLRRQPGAAVADATCDSGRSWP